MKGKRRLPLPRLPRKWRIVRNAAATLLLLGALAAALDFPVLTRYGTFRRLEEQYLLAPARLVYRLDDPGSGAAFLTQGESWIAVGMVEEFDGTFLPHYSGVITQVLDSAEEHVVVLPMRGEESETAAAVWSSFWRGWSRPTPPCTSLYRGRRPLPPGPDGGRTAGLSSPFPSTPRGMRTM